MQLFLLFLAWLAIAVGCHASISRYYPASLTAACAMVAALQLAGYLQLGKPDPLWPLSSLVGFLLAGIVALAVGLPFRIRRIIRAAIENQVALEINARSGLPHDRFIRMAKRMGAKFAFGSNNFDDRPIDMTRCFEAIDRYGLSRDDLYVPAPKKQTSGRPE